LVTITLYRFQVYDPESGEMKASKRWGTFYAIKDLAAEWKRPRASASV
jgi:hypothetical protein